MRGVDDDAVDAGVDQMFGALIALVADGRGGGDAQAALGILAGERMQGRLLDILDRDEADAAVVLVDDESFSSRCWCSRRRASSWLTPSRTVMSVLVISSETGWCGLSAKRTSRLVSMPKSRRLAVGAALDDGNAGNAMAAHQRQRVGQRLVGENGDRIDHHAALVALDLAHFLGLLAGSRLRWMTPMPPAWARAIASLASVTVSIAEEIIGIFRRSSR